MDFLRAFAVGLHQILSTPSLLAVSLVIVSLTGTTLYLLLTRKEDAEKQQRLLRMLKNQSRQSRVTGRAITQNQLEKKAYNAIQEGRPKAIKEPPASLKRDHISPEEAVEEPLNKDTSPGDSTRFSMPTLDQDESNQNRHLPVAQIKGDQVEGWVKGIEFQTAGQVTSQHQSLLSYFLGQVRYYDMHQPIAKTFAILRNIKRISSRLEPGLMIDIRVRTSCEKTRGYIEQTLKELGQTADAQVAVERQQFPFQDIAMAHTEDRVQVVGDFCGFLAAAAQSESNVHLAELELKIKDMHLDVESSHFEIIWNGHESPTDAERVLIEQSWLRFVPRHFNLLAAEDGPKMIFQVDQPVSERPQSDLPEVQSLQSETANTDDSKEKPPLAYL